MITREQLETAYTLFLNDRDLFVSQTDEVKLAVFEHLIENISASKCWKYDDSTALTFHSSQTYLRTLEACHTSSDELPIAVSITLLKGHDSPTINKLFISFHLFKYDFHNVRRYISFRCTRLIGNVWEIKQAVLDHLMREYDAANI